MSVKNPFIIDLKNTNGDVYLKIEKSKVKRFYACIRMMDKAVGDGTLIDEELFAKFFSNISFVDVDVMYEYLGLSREFKSKIIERFIKDKNYSSQKVIKVRVRRSRKNLDDVIPEPVLNPPKKYSIQEVVDVAVDTIFKDYTNKRLKHKRDILIPCYKSIIEIREKYKRKDREFLSNYKIIVIAAYISTHAGFPVTSKKNPSNEALFHGANPTIQKALKNKEQKS